MTHSLQVVRNCTKPLISGWDFLVASSIIVNTRNMTFKENDKVVTMVSPHQCVPKLTKVTVSVMVTVSAMSENIISAQRDVQLKGLIPYNYAGFFEPHYSNHSSTGFAWTVAKLNTGSM